MRKEILSTEIHKFKKCSKLPLRLCCCNRASHVGLYKNKEHNPVNSSTKLRKEYEKKGSRNLQLQLQGVRIQYKKMHRKIKPACQDTTEQVIARIRYMDQITMHFIQGQKYSVYLISKMTEHSHIHTFSIKFHIQLNTHNLCFHSYFFVAF